MTVADLIYSLGNYDPDAKILVKYRDEGGEYYGYDEDVRPFQRVVNNEICVIM